MAQFMHAELYCAAEVYRGSPLGKCSGARQLASLSRGCCVRSVSRRGGLLASSGAH